MKKLLAGALLALLKPGLTYSFSGTNTAQAFNLTFGGSVPRPFNGDPETRNGRTGFLFAGIVRVCGNPGLAAQTLREQITGATLLVPDGLGLKRRVPLKR